VRSRHSRQPEGIDHLDEFEGGRQGGDELVGGGIVGAPGLQMEGQISGKSRNAGKNPGLRGRYRHPLLFLAEAEAINSWRPSARSRPDPMIPLRFEARPLHIVNVPNRIDK
jgi:hypothetical protein